MSALKSIRTHYIQKHKDVFIELPETGLVVFNGENSNGKSVIRKALEDIISYSITNPRVRKSLINRKVSEGYVEIMKYDGTRLKVVLNVEASRTYATLQRSNGEEVTRYLSDKTIPDLVQEFGFHYSKERGISLNICDSDNAILFFKTNHVTNGDVLTSATTDTGAQARAEELKAKYQEAIVMRQTFMDNLKIAQAAKAEIRLYDIAKETDVLNKARLYANILSHVVLPHVAEAKPIPLVSYVSVPVIRISTFRVPPIISLPAINLQGLDQAYKELMSIEKGVCPTCKRPFSLHQTCTSET